MTTLVSHEEWPRRGAIRPPWFHRRSAGRDACTTEVRFDNFNLFFVVVWPVSTGQERSVVGMHVDIHVVAPNAPPLSMRCVTVGMEFERKLNLNDKKAFSCAQKNASHSKCAQQK